MSRCGFWLSLALLPSLVSAQDLPARVPEPGRVPGPEAVPGPDGAAFPLPVNPAENNAPIPVLPENYEPPAVDLISPVPAPKIAFGNPLAQQNTLPQEINIRNRGGTIEGNINDKITLGGPVKITGENGLEVFADRAVVDTVAKSATLEGNVSVYQGNVLQRGSRAVYFYERKFLDTSGLRGSMDPLLLEAESFTAHTAGGETSYIGYNAGVTTDDVENPSYWIRADKTVVYPGDRVVFHDLKLYAGETPVFWLPYLSQPLQAELGYRYIPGARSNWGPFLLNTYGIMLGGKTDPLTGEKQDQWLLSRWHADIRARRGLAFGLDLIDTRLEKSTEITGLGLYYLNDLDPSAERSGVPRGFVNEDRYRLELKHRIFPDFPADREGGWRIDANISIVSDEHFLEDFDHRTFRTNPAPDNTIGMYRRDDASLLSLYTRFQPNDFYRADSRLPEIAFDKVRAPIFNSPVLHEGSTSFGVIGEMADDFARRSLIDPLSRMTADDPRARRLLQQLSGYERGIAARMIRLSADDPRRESLRTQLVDSSYARFHTYQEFSSQFMVGNFLSLVPEAGAGYTSYNNVEGPEDSIHREHLHAALESSVKFSKDYGAVSNRMAGLDGLLHIVQPYAKWSVVSTDDESIWDPRIDRLTPTTRPRPLDPTRFTAIDEMQNWNVLRMGTRNRLLTHRDSQSHEWISVDTYIDRFIEDPEGSRRFSNLYNDIDWQPLPWLALELETQTPVTSEGLGFQEYATRLRFMPNDRWQFAIGHRWLDSHPFLIDSNRLDLDTYFRLSENWGVATKHIYESDDSTLEYQQYSVHRDYGTWVVGVGASARDNRLEKEYGLVFSLTLKDFPNVSLPFELESSR